MIHMATLNLIESIQKTRLTLQKSIWQWHMIGSLVFRVLPAVKQELGQWENYLKTCPPSFLREQALQSIKKKRFHCQGGAAYILLNGPFRNDLLSFITAFQTISDYLDNLCDRLPLWSEMPGNERLKAMIKEDVTREQAFRSLHHSMFQALEKENNKGIINDYYRYYPHKEDGSYLHELVLRCKRSLDVLPNYVQVKEQVRYLTRLYCDLQTFKHLSLQNREKVLQNWFSSQHPAFSFLHWYEFAAASGSTLGVFALLATVSDSDMHSHKTSALFKLYFPWICGLHILLDYFIDQAEDKSTGDLNFVSYYKNQEHCLERMRFFIREALQRTDGLPDAFFHRTIIKGLLALYLSDPKVQEQGLKEGAHSLLKATGEKDTYTLFHTCCLLRRTGWL